MFAGVFSLRSNGDIVRIGEDQQTSPEHMDEHPITIAVMREGLPLCYLVDLPFSANKTFILGQRALLVSQR